MPTPQACKVSSYVSKKTPHARAQEDSRPGRALHAKRQKEDEALPGQPQAASPRKASAPGLAFPPVGSGRHTVALAALHIPSGRPRGPPSRRRIAGHREPRARPTWKMAAPAERKGAGPRRASYKGLRAARGAA